MGTAPKSKPEPESVPQSPPPPSRDSITPVIAEPAAEIEKVTEIQQQEKPKVTLFAVSPAGGRPVLGVAAAGDDVYVVRHATPEIEVHQE